MHFKGGEWGWVGRSFKGGTQYGGSGLKKNLQRLASLQAACHLFVALKCFSVTFLS